MQRLRAAQHDRGGGDVQYLMAAGEPALVVECLNGYRSKERMPSNLGEFRVPLGVPEVLREGDDLTIVSYGSTLNLCAVAAERLSDLGVEVELVDVRTLLPFDRTGAIAASVAKTHRVLFIDEDVPGGASACMLERTLSGSDLWIHLDTAPQTLSAAPHLPAYGTDGDYFSKPSVEDIVEQCPRHGGGGRSGRTPRPRLTVEVIAFHLRTDIIDLLQLLKATGLCATGRRSEMGGGRGACPGQWGSGTSKAQETPEWGTWWSWTVNSAWTSFRA